MRKRRLNLLLSMLLPLAVNAQNSIFNDGEVNSSAIRNMAHNASTGIEAAVYNPAGLSFAPEKFAVSVNGMTNYQQVRCLPFSVDENNENIYGWEQNATIKGISASVQGYAKINKGTISFSYANEGGMKWEDPNGDFFVNYLLENNSELGQLSSELRSIMSEQGLLIYDDDFLNWNTSNYEAKSYNRCVRLGGSYDLDKGFAAYLGLKYNHIKQTTSSDNGLFAFIPSLNKKMKYTDYLAQTIELNQMGTLTNEEEEIIQSIDSILSNGVQISIDYPTTSIRTFSPVFGLAYNLKTLNVGMKYEMSPSVISKTGDLFIPHVISLGISNLFWNKLLVSTSADLKLGFNGNDAMKFQMEDKPIVYQMALGLDYNATNRLKISTSAAISNMVVSTYISNFLNEYIGSLSQNYKVSCGVQCKIGTNFLVDFGMMMNLRKVNVNEYVTSSNSIQRNCKFQYDYRMACGLGLTYVL